MATKKKIFFFPNPELEPRTSITELPKDFHPIGKIFLDLTKSTCPYKHEKEMYKELLESLNATQDGHGNYYVVIEDTTKEDKFPITMFTSHLDTADSGEPKLVEHELSVDEITKDIWVNTDGRTILGADCKAGTALQLYMIQNKIPGLYYFFVGEERGLIGSRELANNWAKHTKFANLKHCISFDRKDVVSVITRQSQNTCCSKDFCEALIKAMSEAEPQIKWKDDPTGTCTDSLAFIEFIPECTNLSVGYYNQHGSDEKQNLSYLAMMAEACLKIDWTSLPATRKPEEISSGKYKKHNTSRYPYDGEDEYWFSGIYASQNTRKETNYHHDDYKLKMHQMLAHLVYCQDKEDLSEALRQDPQSFITILEHTFNCTSEELIQQMIGNSIEGIIKL